MKHPIKFPIHKYKIFVLAAKILLLVKLKLPTQKNLVFLPPPTKYLTPCKALSVKYSVKP